MRFAALLCSILFSLACGDDALPTDAGSDALVEPDAGPGPDSGPDPDAGRPDAGRDAGRLDAGPRDAAADARDAGPAFLESYPLMAVHPEGGAYDDENHRFFMGSLAGGAIRSVDAATGEDTLFYEPTDEGAWWTLGMDVDEGRDRLWVCAMDDLRESGGEPPYDGYVWVFNTETGERVANIDLADVDEDASCTDVVVHSDGSAYVTDRDKGNIYKVTEEGPPELFANNILLEGLLGQNAAVITTHSSPSGWRSAHPRGQPQRRLQRPLAGTERRRRHGDDARRPPPCSVYEPGHATCPGDGGLDER